jgi:heterodisulfide reductase subunit A-like polyferredoxin
MEVGAFENFREFLFAPDVREAALAMCELKKSLSIPDGVSFNEMERSLRAALGTAPSLGILDFLRLQLQLETAVEPSGREAFRVLVVGAGIAGLRASLTLACMGVKFASLLVLFPCCRYSLLFFCCVQVCCHRKEDLLLAK